MPFKSKAQRRKFAQLLVAGKISEETFEEWNRSTGSAALPERVKPNAPAKSGPTRRAKTTATAGPKTARKRAGPVQRKRRP